jgi:hypothetical protein
MARRTAEDQYIESMPEQSSHIGMEFLVNYQFTQTKPVSSINLFSAAVNRFKFKDFVLVQMIIQKPRPYRMRMECGCGFEYY